jgi:predicted MFS family arabinose efflux permease
MLVNRSGSLIIGFMSLYLTKELGFSLSRAGFIMGAFGLGSIIGSYLGGYITDRKGFYHVIVWSLIISGCIALPLFFIKDFLCITVLVFLFSLIADMFRPANSVAVATFSKPEDRTRSISLMRLAINLGFAIGPAMGGILAVYLGFKWIFVIEAITCISAGILVLSFLPRPNFVEKKEETKFSFSKESSVFNDKTFLGFLFLVTIYGTFFFQLFTSVPVHFSKSFQFSEDTIGYLLGLNGLLVVLLEMPIVYRIGNSPNQGLIIGIGCLMMFIAYSLLYINSPLISICIVYTLFITLSEIFAMPVMMNYTLSKPIKERQGQYVGMYSIAYGISHILAPNIGLKFIEKYGFPLFYLLAAILSIFLGLAFFYFMKSKK